jgi:hypothetical protein
MRGWPRDAHEGNPNPLARMSNLLCGTPNVSQACPKNAEPGS